MGKMPARRAGKLGEAVAALGQPGEVARAQITGAQGLEPQATAHGSEDGAPIEGEGFLCRIKHLQQNPARAALGPQLPQQRDLAPTGGASGRPEIHDQ